MSFSERIRRKEVENSQACAICTEKLPADAYTELHSATSLHLVYDQNSNKFRVTDPPMGHEILKGRTINTKIFSQGVDKGHDGYCLCPVCHDEIKRIALAESKHRDPAFKGNTPPPKILQEVTTFFVERKRPIVHDEVLLPEEKSQKSKIVFI